MAVSRLNVQRHLALALFAAFALRVGFGMVYWTGKPLTHDEREYLALAASLSAGHGFSYTEPAEGTTAQFGRAPGYPAFLALVGAGSTDAMETPTRVKLIQAVLGTVTVWLIASTAGRLGPRAGLLGAWVAAAYPPLVWISSYVLSETLYSVLALGTVVALQRAIDRRESRGTSQFLPVCAGVLCGISILVRPAMLFFVPIAALWLIVRKLNMDLLLFLLGAGLVVAPWTVRNVLKYDRFVLIASEGGVTFWTGNHPLSSGEGDLAANPELKRAELEFRRSHAGLTAEELEPLYYRDAAGRIAADPIWWAGLLGKKVFYTVVPAGPSYALHSTRYRWASIVSYLLLLPFGIAGLVLLWRRSAAPTALLLLAASSLVVCVIFFPQERFRIPVIDPALVVCAAALAQRNAPSRSSDFAT
jgi:hypothetical protein